MKKRVACFMVLCLFILSNTAFATNWVFFERRSDPNDPGVRIYSSSYNIYIDAESVFKDGNSFVYWEKKLFDNPSYGAKEYLTNWVVNLPTQQFRTLETHMYDSKNHEIYTNYSPGDWTKYDPNSLVSAQITFALRYARQGSDIGQKPTP